MIDRLPDPVAGDEARAKSDFVC
jgi:hypothetical protein